MAESAQTRLDRLLAPPRAKTCLDFIKAELDATIDPALYTWTPPERQTCIIRIQRNPITTITFTERPRRDDEPDAPPRLVTPDAVEVVYWTPRGGREGRDGCTYFLAKYTDEIKALLDAIDAARAKPKPQPIEDRIAAIEAKLERIAQAIKTTPAPQPTAPAAPPAKLTIEGASAAMSALDDALACAPCALFSFSMPDGTCEKSESYADDIRICNRLLAQLKAGDALHLAAKPRSRRAKSENGSTVHIYADGICPPDKCSVRISASFDLASPYQVIRDLAAAVKRGNL